MRSLGPVRHTLVALACALTLVAPASAQDAPSENAPSETAPNETAPNETAPSETAPGETAPSETAPNASAPTESAPTESAPTESAPVDGATGDHATSEFPDEPAPATEDATAAQAPRVAAQVDVQSDLDTPSAESVAGDPLEPTAEPIGPRPRDWRYPRQVIRRPLTMPQGVGRFDSIVAFTLQPSGTSGSIAHMSGYVAAAVGIFDELEVGAVPLSWTFFWPQDPDDPYVYLRARALSGDVQLAFRGGVWIPIMNQPGVAQIQLAAELAWRAADFFRVDLSLDYQLLFSEPLHQRVGVPVTATFQAGIHAIALTTGVFVFNDADDIDVPLLLGYTVPFSGYRQPIGEWSFEGGFLDLENALRAWTMRSRFTFFI